MEIPNYRSQVVYEEIYNDEELGRMEPEFRRLENVCYLDHAGTTLYAKSQLEAYISQLQENVFGNPHSRNPSSSLTTDAIDAIRLRILGHFGTSGDEYAVIFTSGATSALKILAETFTFNGGPFVYLEESHTSVIGIRELVKSTQTLSNGIHAVPKNVMEAFLNARSSIDQSETSKLNFQNETQAKLRNGLVAYPAQCNFSGYKYPLEWIQEIQSGKLAPLVESRDFLINQSDSTNLPDNWYVLLDAAAFAGTNYLNLSKFPADFVVLSFYKMFGFPTGLGALLVRRRTEKVLEKKYFGGGTLQVLDPSTNFHVKKQQLHQRFEDGTLPFLSILSLNHGFDTWIKLGVSLEKISIRTFRLAQYAYRVLVGLKYPNGQPVAEIYNDSNYESVERSGGVVSFNLLRQDGTFIGYSQVEEIAFLHRIHLRYGCFCNPGACRRFLKHKPEDILRHFVAGHVCGDMRDLVEEKPTGAVRVSFGYMTKKADVDFLLDLIHRSWLYPFHSLSLVKNSFSLTPSQWERSLTPPDILHSPRRLLRIFLYPIKSCAPFEVKGDWPLGKGGLLFDREWLIMNSMGVPLTQKREPRLCFLQPSLDLCNRRLWISATGFPDLSLPLDNTTNQKRDIEAEICNSKVCGEKVSGMDCGKKVNDWISLVLNQSGLKMIRILPNSKRKQKQGSTALSLANDSQYLLVTSGSLLQLAGDLETKGISYQSDSAEEDEEKSEDNCIQKSARNLLRRFRPNFLVSEWIPYEEENWDQIQIASFIFKSGGPCSRCGTICLDQKTGQRSSEPLLTLAARRNGNPKFGIHLHTLNSEIENSQSTISIGDTVTIVQKIQPNSSITHLKLNVKPQESIKTSSSSYSSLLRQNQRLISDID